MVRDALTIGPTQHEDEVTPHTRAPADEDAHHMLVRTVLCMEGSVDMELICEPGLRLRADARRVVAAGTGTPPTRAERG